MFRVEKKQKMDVKLVLGGISKKLRTVKDPYLTAKYDTVLEKSAARLAEEKKQLRAKLASFGNNENNAEGAETASRVYGSTVAALDELKETLKEVISQTRPNFFRIGFYMYKNPDAKLDPAGRSIEEINDMALSYLNENFMSEFIELERKGVRHSFEKALEGKKKFVALAAEAKEFFLKGGFEKAEAYKKCKEMSEAAEASIDRLATVKDSDAYTFGTGLRHAIDSYFYYKANNPKEEARFERQTKKREALLAKGKTVDWKVVPKIVVELDEQAANIAALFDRLTKKYEAEIAAAESVDFRRRSIELIDFLKEKASQVVYLVTKRIAREKAIKLMEEVGIPEPRIRYNQYPFEFSGGMRQRIVIAIALAANPDILICDEPTTALDVTIQSQILELINKLKTERNLSVIFITHDLGVVANMADKIAVMYAGKIVEYGRYLLRFAPSLYLGAAVLHARFGHGRKAGRDPRHAAKHDLSARRGRLCGTQQIRDENRFRNAAADVRGVAHALGGHLAVASRRAEGCRTQGDYRPYQTHEEIGRYRAWRTITKCF